MPDKCSLPFNRIFRKTERYVDFIFHPRPGKSRFATPPKRRGGTQRLLSERPQQSIERIRVPLSPVRRRRRVPRLAQFEKASYAPIGWPVSKIPTVCPPHQKSKTLCFTPAGHCAQLGTSYLWIAARNLAGVREAFLIGNNLNRERSAQVARCRQACSTSGSRASRPMREGRRCRRQQTARCSLR